MGRSIALRGGTLVDAAGERCGDLVIEDGRIIAEDPGRTDEVIDCSGRLVLPGLVDAHSHADGLLADPDVQRAMLRQGVTTVIAGQDGVSYSPGDGAYAAEYFAAIDGPRPAGIGDDVAGYLAWADGVSALNAAYLVPAGTVRRDVCGRSRHPAGPDELAAMTALVAHGLRQGAVGLSTGLDYVPAIFQSSAEIAALCAPVAAAGGVYVTHMRGGYEANSPAGIEEISVIAAETGRRSDTPLRVHVSHLHAEADIVLDQLDVLAAADVDATFDAYPYTRGCSLLSMPLLPAELSARPVGEVLTDLADIDQRARRHRDWSRRLALNPSLGPDWAQMITFAHIAAAGYAWALGLTVADAAARAGADPLDLALDVLAASRLEVNVVMAVQKPRPVSELARIFAHPAHVGGSDGIFVGAHPHPRARGAFARFLREYVRETGTWTWTDAVQHLSRGAVRRFGLGARGSLRPGAIADVIVVDPAAVSDTATYEQPLGESVGIDDVVVAGIPVLAGGAPTGRTPGRGIRFDARTAGR